MPRRSTASDFPYNGITSDHIIIFLKIAALSPEFSIREETESPEQSPGPGVEASLSPSAETQATSAGRPKDGRLFDWGPGRRKFNEMKARSTKHVAKSKKIKENQYVDTCEHKLELLESSQKWRDIRKTLHWLNRILASNQTNMELCHRRKDPRRRSSFHSKIKNSDLHASGLKKKKFFKKSANQGFNWGRRNYKTKTHSRQKKKLNNERKHKQRSWKNRLREERNKKEKLENKRKEPRFDKYFERKDPMKFSRNNAPTLNTTFLKPNSVLFDAERIFFPRTKNKGENDFKSHQFTNSLIKNVKKCEDLKCTQKTNEGPEWGSEEIKSKEHDHENGSGTKTPKQKPWPHFVYHRVSSNFLYPDATNQNHKQSAYLAISVVTSSKPDPTDNNEDI